MFKQELIITDVILDHAIGAMWINQRLKGVHEDHAIVISTFHRKLAAGLLTIKYCIK